MDKKLTLGPGRKINTIKPIEEPTIDEELDRKLEDLNNRCIASKLLTLAGTTKSDYDFKTLVVKQPLKLVKDPYGRVVKPEEGHPDPTAVSVQDNNGRHIGYLKREVAKVVTNGIDDPRLDLKVCVEKIKGGSVKQDGETLNYGVDILLEVYKKEAN